MMKRMMKVVALALALALMLSVAAIAQEKTYIVGTNPEFPPFEFVGDSGAIEGIDAEIIALLFEKIGKPMEIVAMDFDALIPSLVTGKIDVVIAGLTADDERRKSVDFTDPYFDAMQAIIVKEGSPIATEADLEGKKIGVQMGTTGDLYVTEFVKDAQINQFNKGIDAVQDVASGRLDAVVIDDAPAAVFAKALGLKVLDEKLNSGNEQYAIALPKGSELTAELNAAMAELRAEGTLDAIFAKHQG